MATPTPAELYADPSVSYWLKDAVQSCLKRDPVNAWYDARLLLAVLTQIMDNISHR